LLQDNESSWQLAVGNCQRAVCKLQKIGDKKLSCSKKAMKYIEQKYKERLPTANC
jgi:hypothetical protein